VPGGQAGRLAGAAAAAVASYRSAMDAFALQEGMAAAYSLIDAANVYIADTEPWKLAKDEAHAPRVAQILYEVAEALRGGVRLRSMERVLQEETVVAAFRHPALDDERAKQLSEFAREQVGKPYDFVGVVMHAPFALQRRVCELPGVPTFLREACLSTLATFQLIHGGDDRFFCSQFVLESYRVAGLPITRARPHWVSPEDIMHMRAGDVPSLPVEQPLTYVGHLKFTALAMPLPGLMVPMPLPPSGEARAPAR